MIQTTIFNYLNCNDGNESPIQSKYKSYSSFKQTNLTNYFKTIPKRKNLILDYFKPKEKEKKEKEKKEKEKKEKEKKEKEEAFDIVLVDINSTCENEDISCIKKNMYDLNLKYIAISYRWGEYKEQLLKTPDYTAHITSFYLVDLINLCGYIKREPDLKEIPYLWVDAISVDQQNHSKKKETILKMSNIYKNSAYILALPDLHYSYLLKNTANNEVMELIYKYSDIIHQDIFNIINSDTDPIQNIKNSTFNTIQNVSNHHHSVIQRLKNKLIKECKENEKLRIEIEEKKLRKEKEELKKAYRFLAYLIYDWSNRAWVISEYQIAKEKYEKHRISLKYTFLSLLYSDKKSLSEKTFFSYTFVDQYNYKNSGTSNPFIDYKKVDNSSKFINLLESRFIQRSYINMIVGSSASRNEDRFYAILPSWNKYNNLIKNKNTISEWNIADFLSVKLKLYEILDGDDDDELWNKARLLYHCSIYYNKPILPSFATSYQADLIVNEIDNIDYTHKSTLDYLSKLEDTKEYIKDYKKEFESLFKQNLIDIQFNKRYCHLTVKAYKYFIFNTLGIQLSQTTLSNYSLNDTDDLKLIYIPYFTYNIPEFSHPFPLNSNSIPKLSGTLLLGNMDINRWVLYELRNCHTFEEPSLYSTNGYMFNIY